MLLAPTMFLLSVLFLIGIASLVVLLVDVPSLGERTGSGDEVAAAVWDPPEDSRGVERFAHGVILLMAVIWPVFWAESLLHWMIRPWCRGYRLYHLFGLVHALLPPLRMCARSPDMAEAIWFPWVGWKHPDDPLRDALARFFSIPMLGIAILILPVLGVEFFLSEQVHQHAALRFGLHFSTGLIWFAFTTEYIVMSSAAEHKLAYAKQHWLDLAIILLPIISFLRSLRVLRATRLAKVTKVQQLTKMARVYRLRGVSTKALRALVLFDLLQRLLRIAPEKRLQRMRKERARLEKELSLVEAKIAELHVEVQQRTANTELSDGRAG